MKILAGIMLVTLVVTQKEICQHLGFGQSKQHDTSITATLADEQLATDEFVEDTGNYLINDSIYRWDEKRMDWVTVNVLDKTPTSTLVSYSTAEVDAPPTVIDWKLLLDIEYQLKYFSEIEMKMYAPVFTDALKALDGKEIIIQGFVIPFDETGEVVALSANPFASCFFCGKASPASVISLYLKNKERYKMDDLRKFQGTLELNYDDPGEYYYILRDAVPVDYAAY